MPWKKATIEQINTTANRHPENDIALAGPFHGSNSTLLWYCFRCERYFRQGYRSLQRSCKARCECNHPEPLSQQDATKGHYQSRGISGFKGHRCLPEWDCYDRTPPPRPTKDPQDRV